jgi:hypothetical protein
MENAIDSLDIILNYKKRNVNGEIACIPSFMILIYVFLYKSETTLL